MMNGMPRSAQAAFQTCVIGDSSTPRRNKGTADEATAMEKMHQRRCRRHMISIPTRRDRHPQQK